MLLRLREGMKQRFISAWRLLRQMSGDDAYERYLRLYAANQQQHQHASPPLSREAFCKAWQEDKWNGVKRCC